MGIFGDIYAKNVHQSRFFHHTSFFGGAPVAAASIIIAKNGIIKKIIGCSNHYKPKDDVVKQAIDSLKKQGYTRDIQYASCKSLLSDYMVQMPGHKIPPACGSVFNKARFCSFGTRKNTKVKVLAHRN